METTQTEIRKFAFTLATMLCIFAYALLPWLYDIQRVWPPAIIAAVLVLLALAIPCALKPVYAGWMKFATALGWLNSRIILALVYFLVVTPMGLVARLIGYKPMQQQQQADSYYMQPKSTAIDMEKPF